MKSVQVVIGMQFGSEGKGKVVHSMTKLKHYEASVRVGAPNAGHTIIHEGKAYKMRSIPCAWTDPDTHLYIGPGGLINLESLAEELAMLPKSHSVYHRLHIDINAGIVTHEDSEEERKASMYESIGSTCEGIGPAMARKLLRRDGLVAKDVQELQPYLTNVGQDLNQLIDDGYNILVEGTQGYGLSLNHGYYPYVTSRDVLASSILGECGLAPSTASVVGVLRTYPIRVHGNSGPMGAEELTWEQVAQESGYLSLEERTTVTKRIRRVSRISWELLEAATKANRPDSLAITFADYLDANEYRKTNWSDLTQKTKDFVNEVERRLSTKVSMISTGPNAEDLIVIGG